MSNRSMQNKVSLSAMHKSWRLLGLLVVAAVALLGCSERPPATSESLEQPPVTDRRLTAVAEGVDGDFPVVVHDLLDRRVRLPKRPTRIISLTPSTTELLFAIGAGSQLVGATEHCNHPPEASDIPRVGGGTLESVSREGLLNAQPDLVLCKWDNHEPLIDMLDEFSIPSLGLGPETLDDLYEEISLLGKVTGHEANAERLIAQMKARVTSLTALVSDIPPEKRCSVFYEVWDEPLMTAGPNSFIGEILQLAGTRNIFSDTDTRYPRVSAEAVVARNPDVILAPSTHATEVSREQILSRPGWEHVNAISSERVYLISGDQVSRCGPRLVDALEEVISFIYPAQYEAMGPCAEPPAVEDAVP